jgi:hypothetical protein
MFIGLASMRADQQQRRDGPPAGHAPACGPVLLVKLRRRRSQRGGQVLGGAHQAPLGLGIGRQPGAALAQVADPGAVHRHHARPGVAQHGQQIFGQAGAVAGWRQPQFAQAAVHRRRRPAQAEAGQLHRHPGGLQAAACGIGGAHHPVAQGHHPAGALAPLALQRHGGQPGQQGASIAAAGLQLGLQAVGCGEHAAQGERLALRGVQPQRLGQRRMGAVGRRVLHRPEGQPPLQPLAGRQIHLPPGPAERRHQRQDLVVRQRLHGADRSAPRCVRAGLPSSARRRPPGWCR